MEVLKKCGECTACCFVLVIPEISKPGLQKCKHQNESGCSCYKTRPKPCRQFECFWKISSLLPDDCRPDLMGVMYVSYDVDGVKSIKGYGLKKDALKSPEAEMVGLLIQRFFPKKIVGKYNGK